MFRISCLTVSVATAVAVLSHGGIALADGKTPMFERTLETGIKDPVSLSVAVSTGNVEISYSRDDQLTVYAYGKGPTGENLPEEYFKTNLIIEQKDGVISVRDARLDAPSLLGSLSSVTYRFDVPYRTKVESTVSGSGNQTLVGVFGPATLTTGTGDIDARYVRFATLHASTGKGNISCIRDFQVDAQTDTGNITLMEDGDSKAVVKGGHGRIDIGGARGAVNALTEAGSLHIKAALSGDWQLQSSSGSILLQLPPKSKFDIEANTESGEIVANRDDMKESETEIHHLQQQVNGGGKHILARSVKGSISIE